MIISLSFNDYLLRASSLACLQWIGCANRNCRRWVHVECEAEAGSPVRKGETKGYQCPGCREVRA